MILFTQVLKSLFQSIYYIIIFTEQTRSKVLLSIKLRHVCTVKKKLHKHLLKKKGLIHDCKQAKRDFKLRLKHLQTGQN